MTLSEALERETRKYLAGVGLAGVGRLGKYALVECTSLASIRVGARPIL